MKNKKINFFFGLSFFSAALLCLVAISSLNVMAQQDTAAITVDKYVCDSVGQQNTCNGRISNLEGQTINFTVFDATGLAPETTREQIEQIQPSRELGVIGVLIKEGNGSQGSTTVRGVYIPGTEYLVCETVPGGFDTLPRPDQSTGGSSQSRVGDCIRFTAVEGNNVLQFINYLEDIGPTSAHASISGRVLDPRGRGVSRVRVVVTDSNGFTQMAFTNPFGHYRFDSLPTGEIYIIGAFDKRYVFTPLVVNLMEDLGSLNLVVGGQYSDKFTRRF